MVILCTSELLNKLKIEPEKVTVIEPLFAWYARTLKVKAREAIVLVNAQNAFTIILSGFQDYSRFNELFIAAIRESLLNICISEKVVDEYLENSSKIICSKWKIQPVLREACDLAATELVLVTDGDILPCDLNKMINDIITDESGFTANKAMIRDLEKFSGNPVISCKAAVLNIKLKIDNHNVFRKINVPFTFTFEKLQNYLQTIFGVINTGHEFRFPGNLKVNESSTKLKDLIPKYMHFEYEYGYENKWKFIIDVEEIIQDHPKDYIEGISGEGIAPTQEVSDAEEYEQFLHDFYDEGISDYEFVIRWHVERRFLKK